LVHQFPRSEQDPQRCAVASCARRGDARFVLAEYRPGSGFGVDDIGLAVDRLAGS
jgi:hypothetical protein